MPMVDGNQASEDERGIVQGDGGAEDRVAGDGTSNIIQGNAAQNFYYGGGGDDAFKIVASKADGNDAASGASRDYDDQFVVIFDFEGAGVSNGDFVVFDGFDADSLTLTGTGTSGTPGATLYYYSVTSSESGEVYNFLVNSLTGEQLQAGDFNFY